MTTPMGDQPVESRPGAGLGGLAALAARGFGSTAEATQALLGTIVAQLGLRTSFLTRISVEEGRNVVVAAHNGPGGCDIPVGADLPLEDTF